VYCILESTDLQEMLDRAPEGLESGQKLEIVSSAGLVAVVSAVPLSQYGEAALEANLTDAGWAATRVMRHEQVVEHFASRLTVIPLRFGTIYIDKKSIGQMLANQAAEFNSVIARLRGSQDCGVFIYCDHSRLIDNVASNSSAIQPLIDRAGSAPPGQQYLLSKQIEGLKAKEARDEISAAVVRIRETLDAVSEQSVSSPRPERRRTERGDLIARLSFLVQTSRFDRFTAAAECLAQAHLSSGFHIELVGPLPPYSFVAETSSQARVP